jgi:hypothetical protein
MKMELRRGNRCILSLPGFTCTTRVLATRKWGWGIVSLASCCTSDTTVVDIPLVGSKEWNVASSKTRPNENKDNMSIPPAATDDIAATFGRAPIQAHRTLCQNLLVSLCSVFAVVQDVDRRSRRGRCGSLREREHTPTLASWCAAQKDFSTSHSCDLTQILLLATSLIVQVPQLFNFCSFFLVLC